jgi:hypothetical protein
MTTIKDDKPIGGHPLFEQMAADFRARRQLPVVADALKDASLDDTEYELQQATAIALRDSSLPDKWIHGEFSALSSAMCPQG